MLAPSRGLDATVPDSCPISIEMPLIDWRIEVIHTLLFGWYFFFSSAGFGFDHIWTLDIYIYNMIRLVHSLTLPFSFAYKTYQALIHLNTPSCILIHLDAS